MDLLAKTCPFDAEALDFLCPFVVATDQVVLSSTGSKSSVSDNFHWIQNIRFEVRSGYEMRMVPQWIPGIDKKVASELYACTEIVALGPKMTKHRASGSLFRRGWIGPDTRLYRVVECRKGMTTRLIPWKGGGRSCYRKSDIWFGLLMHLGLQFGRLGIEE